MAQISLGQVVPSIEITDTNGGKNIKFITTTQEVETVISNGSDGFSPIATMSVTPSTLTISIQDSEGTKTQSIEKGTAVYYQEVEPNSDDAVVWIS